MKHLSSEQISKVVAGTCDSQEERHGRECEKCGTEVTRARDVLSMFRSSVREWTETQSHSEFVGSEISSLRVRMHRQPLAWVLATMVLAVVVAVPAYRNAKDRELREMQAQAERDVLLIEDVNAHLSQKAPMAMEPLLRLMSDSKKETDSKNDLKKHGGVQ